MSLPDAMDHDSAAALQPLANDTTTTTTAAAAAAAQTATAPEALDTRSHEGTPVHNVPAAQTAVPSTETPPTSAPAAATAAAAAATSTSAAQPQHSSTASPAPAPARTGTPVRTAGDTGSRAGSLHPEPSFSMPAEAAPHGAPARVYLNTKVTGVLLEGMKMIAKDQPNDPLRVLGEFLLQRSREMETTG